MNEKTYNMNPLINYYVTCLTLRDLWMSLVCHVTLKLKLKLENNESSNVLEPRKTEMSGNCEDPMKLNKQK